MLILDCCRNKPTLRCVDAQLTRPAVPADADGSLVLYACEPCEVAGDGEHGENGYLVRALLQQDECAEHGLQPALHSGCTPVEVFEKVRNRVAEMTQHVSRTTGDNRQQPWLSYGYKGHWKF